MESAAHYPYSQGLRTKTSLCVVGCSDLNPPLYDNEKKSKNKLATQMAGRRVNCEIPTRGAHVVGARGRLCVMRARREEGLKVSVGRGRLRLGMISGSGAHTTTTSRSLFSFARFRVQGRAKVLD